MIALQPQTIDNDQDYELLLQRIDAHGATHLFTTDAADLFDTFLANLPIEYRQHYTCNCCRKFIDTYGGLVTIDEAGTQWTAVLPFSDPPPFFRDAIHAVSNKVERAKITGIFYSSAKVWGTPVTGKWHHMHVNPPTALMFSDRLKTPFQAMAEKAEDYKIVQRSLGEYPLAAVETALAVLKSDTLYRSEKVLGVAEWFKVLHESVSGVKNTKIRSNLIWRAVAAAPVGFAHIRSSMIGTLLDDIVAGLPFDSINRRFAEKMNPLQYQRPQAAPTVGNIAQAEKLVEKLGIAPSLRRRFARLDEVQALWRPKLPAHNVNDNGVFGHLKPKGATTPQPMQVSAKTITWTKFQRDVLPTAESIELWISSSNANYTALCTAVDPDAPPILQWDSEAKRNPVSWYVYNGGSTPSRWGLTMNTYCKVNAVCLQPNLWTSTLAHQGQGVVFILDGAKDSSNQSLALFPEILKSELREVRSVIEAHSKAGKLEGQAEASACGLILQASSRETWRCSVRVTSGSVVATYNLDRWE